MVHHADSFPRIITICQVLWFSITTVARLIQHLEITTLELTTLGFIFCMLGTSYCWTYKPSDVERPLILESKYTISEIRSKAGEPVPVTYKYTPLDFVSRREWSVSLFWAYYIQLLRSMRLGVFERPIKAKPRDRIPGINWPAVTARPLLLCILSLMMIIYVNIFVCAWNFSFPTPTERTLWRISSLLTVSYIFEMAPIELYLTSKARAKKLQVMRAYSIEQQREAPSSSSLRWSLRTWRNKARRAAQRLRNNSPDNDPALDIPLRVLIPGTIFCASYTLARLYILTEDIVGLRALPPGAFEDVDWSRYFPHS